MMGNRQSGIERARERIEDRDPQSSILDLAAIRARLSESKGEQYWRSLEELAETEEFQEFLHREFPDGATEMADSVSRRHFLKVMGASLALAGVGGCVHQPAEQIMPYAKPPEEMIPGKPLFFATAFPFGGYANGVLVESNMGRPTKIEGNPQHPSSLGATDAITQASLLTLYDPDRSQVVLKDREISTWDDFITSLSRERSVQQARKGAGLGVLTETVTSPTLGHQLQALLTMFPKAKWHQYEPANRDAVREGARLAFGEYVETRYQLDRAEVILSLDADLLGSMPGSVRYARDFAAKRRVRSGQAKMNRLYAVESTPTITGAMADHRLPSRAGDIEGFARQLAAKLGIAGFSSKIDGGGPKAGKWIDALAKDLQNNRGTSLVVAGDHQPAEVHAIAHAINHALGNVGTTVLHTEPVEINPTSQTESIRDLLKDIEAGRVESLLILGGNPVYDAPVDLRFEEKIQKVPFTAHLSLYNDETSNVCRWHVPAVHYLEAWGDARAVDGTVTIMQPLIAPLYEGKSSHEILAAFLGKSEVSTHEILRGFWKERYGKPTGLPTDKDFEHAWKKAIHDGVVAGTAFVPKAVALKSPAAAGQPSSFILHPSSLEINFRPDPTIWDGRFANNGWLQELPKPLTKLTWDNAALISPAMAQQLKLVNEDVVELRYRKRALTAPIWITMGHPDHSVTLHLGYGRARGGKVAEGAGANAYALRTAESPWFDSGVEIRKTGRRYLLAATQQHHSMEGRNLVREATLQGFVDHPESIREMDEEKGPLPSMYPGFKNEGYSWGMSIDLNACIGCNACTLACQSENNIPVVGKKMVRRGREMHWLRIDRYYKEDLDNPEVLHQPVMCMHCENAPCEPVCPVGATVHSPEGLNEMVYNRCVGTRYCSNNCPYKVRRFNFLQFSDQKTPSLQLLNNPDVTVRTRGVMEKCTYCVQRIQSAKIQSEEENRTVRDGEIVTACQQVCPTGAIVFGDLKDPRSNVTKLKQEPHDYGMLTELNTRPRTTYLAKLRNPNPELGDL